MSNKGYQHIWFIMTIFGSKYLHLYLLRVINDSWDDSTKYRFQLLLLRIRMITVLYRKLSRSKSINLAQNYLFIFLFSICLGIIFLWILPFLNLNLQFSLFLSSASLLLSVSLLLSCSFFLFLLDTFF